jgi:hypothetical protein
MYCLSFIRIISIKVNKWRSSYDWKIINWKIKEYQNNIISYKDFMLNNKCLGFICENKKGIQWSEKPIIKGFR